MPRGSRRIALKGKGKVPDIPASSYEEPILPLTRNIELPVTPVRSPRKKNDVDSSDTPISTFSVSSRVNNPTKIENTPSIPFSPLRRLEIASKRSAPSSAKVCSVYKVIQKSTGFLGGNGSFGAVYGELTQGSMQAIVNLLKEKCELDMNSRFVDIGSGLGKPSLHVAYDVGCELSYGIELEVIRYQLCMINLKHVLSNCLDGGSVGFQLGDAFNLKSIEPFSHIFQFDLGFPPSLQQSIAAAFNKSTTAKYLVSFRPPRRITGMYGYKVKLVEKIMTSMHGSSEGHTCYFYVKVDKNKRVVTPIHFSSSLSACPIDAEFQTNMQVYLTADWRTSVQANTILDVENYLNSKRPVRVRKERILLDY